MEFFGFLIFIVLFLPLILKLSFRDDNTIYSRIIDKCKFQRLVLRSNETRRIYLHSRKKFSTGKKDYITHRFLKNLEFTIVELIILNLMLIRKSKDSYISLPIKEKNNQLITKYLSVFNDEDLELVKKSLISRFLMNLYSLDTDVFTLYNEISSFCIKELKMDISYDFVLYTKKNLWHPKIAFDSVYLQVLHYEIMKP